MYQPKPVNIALQGGGSHGAFTAGVLSRLSEEQELQIDAISGTSSGSVNACLYLNGMLGESSPSICLDDFWQELGDEFDSIFKPFNDLSKLNLFSDSSGEYNLDLFLKMTQSFAPYVFNPSDMNPLENLISKHIDFERISQQNKIKCFVAATNIRTSKLKIFETHELSKKHILASTCLPSLHHAVEIEGETYWDGGFAGNPAVFPLIFNSANNDVLIVMVYPLSRDEIPKTAERIRERILDISFNSSFMREMRAISFSQQLIKNDWFHMGSLEKKLSQLRIHIINGGEYLKDFRSTSRFNASSDMISELKSAGYEAADDWLKEHGKKIGQKNSVDIHTLFG